jgi:hypothetical protein
MTHLRIALLVSDGPGVRNFVLGPFLDRAAQQAEAVCVIHPIPDHLLPRYPQTELANVRFEPLQAFADTPLSFTLRNTLGYAHMYWADTGGMRYNRGTRISGSWKTRAAIRAARAAGRVLASPKPMGVLDGWHEAEVQRGRATEHYRRLFAETRPTVLFCSNQRAPAAAPAVMAAKSLGIPTATFIFSWDNISSKGRVIARFDHYLVWSEHMRDELLEFYPLIKRDQVHVVGTPQFDPYADAALVWSREEFMARIRGDAARPLICYSGGDPTVYTAEYEYLRLLMEMVRAGRISGSPQVLLRPSPADSGRQWESVRREFPEVLYAPPAWEHTSPGEWGRIVPMPEDIQMLANVTRHSDVNINLNSTMTLDFAIQGRPVINIAFDVLSPPPFGEPLWDFFYKFEHYHPVIEFGAARFARTADELVTALNRYLADPSLDREGRQRFIDLEVSVPAGCSTNRLLDTLAAIGPAPVADARSSAALAQLTT